MAKVKDVVQFVMVEELRRVLSYFEFSDDSLEILRLSIISLRGKWATYKRELAAAEDGAIDGGVPDAALVAAAKGHLPEWLPPAVIKNSTPVSLIFNDEDGQVKKKRKQSCLTPLRIA